VARPREFLTKPQPLPIRLAIGGVTFVLLSAVIIVWQSLRGEDSSVATGLLAGGLIVIAAAAIVRWARYRR